MAHLIYIHGIANKPVESDLLRIWRRTLDRDLSENPGFGLGEKGVRSSMIYWADVMYDLPDPDVSNHESNGETQPRGMPEDIDAGWLSETEGEEGQSWMQAMEAEYGFDAAPPDGDDCFVPSAQGDDGRFERIPLPWFIKRRFMKAFVRDTHHYLFNVTHSPRAGTIYKVRDEIRARFVAKLKEASTGDGPLVIVAHSQGTVVAYDCLKNVMDCPPIDALITLGSPLGLDEVQQKMDPGYSRLDGFPGNTVKDGWQNIFDPLDMVSRPDPKLANDYCRTGLPEISDLAQTNNGYWRHSMTEYLAGQVVRRSVRDALGLPHPD